MCGGGGCVGAVGVLRLAVCASVCVSLVRVLEKMSLGKPHYEYQVSKCPSEHRGALSLLDVLFSLHVAANR